MSSKSFLEEALANVAAANELVRDREARALAAGRSVYFNDEDGRIYERHRDGIFEIVMTNNGGWTRTRKVE